MLIHRRLFSRLNLKVSFVIPVASVLLLLLTSSSGFEISKNFAVRYQSPVHTLKSNKFLHKIALPSDRSGRRPVSNEVALKMGISPLLNTVTNIRGGSQIIQTLSASLKSGPTGILSLWAISSSLLIPLTLYRQAYSFSVGYGFSVMVMGIACLLTFAPLPSFEPSFLLATSVIFYGFRLGSFLLLRNITVPSKAEQTRNFDKTPPLQRIPLAASVALLYSFMTCPAMYALRSGVGGPLALTGAIVAWVGVLIEAIADGQKFAIKRGANEETFVGPTGGTYSISRHPNYLGELLFWSGLFIGGAPSFGKSPEAWICSILGLSSIWAIMTGATKRLDAKQEDKYAGQESYDSWKKKVNAPLFPFVSG